MSTSLRCFFWLFTLGACAAQDTGTITELRSQLAAQDKQMQQMDARIQDLERIVARLTGSGTAATAASTERSVAAAAPAIAQTAPAAEPKPAPLTVRIGGIDFKPGGFMDFTSIYRSTDVGSGIGTAFGSIPFNNTPAGRLSESRFSAQNSRVSLKVTGKLGKQNITGYVESDFLGAQPANAFVTSNSNSMRLRLYWADVQRGKWEVLGGQSWSMLTPNRIGLSAAPSDIFYSQNMDTNYQVGLLWTRAPQFRLIYHPNSEWALGVALENPQQFIGGSVVLPPALASPYAGQLDNGTLTSTPNLHPDIIAKAAFDRKVRDRHMHLEAAGVLRSFHVFNPLTNSSPTTTGGGGSVNANLELVKNFRFIWNSFYSYGGGRYIFGLGPDLIIRPDGEPSLVHAGAGISGLEYQATAKTLYYGYYGAAYYQRNFSIDPATRRFVGFGFPGSSGANRAIQQATFGIIRTFWRNPNYGALQLITQYSYVLRSPWATPADQPKNAHTNLGYVNLRYALP